MCHPPQEKKNQKKITQQWLKRTAHHWKTISYQDLSDLSNQTDKGNQPLASRTREKLNIQNQQQTKTKKVSRFCLVHFHPKLIEKYGSKIPKAIPESDAQLLGLFNKNGGSFYSQADTILDEKGKQCLVLLLPIYSLKEALSDLKEVQKIKKMDTEIEKVTSMRITSVSDRRNSSPDSQEPIQQSNHTATATRTISGEKRKREEPSKKELKEENEGLR